MTTTSTLHIRLFGDFLLTFNDHPIPGIDIPRLQSLLAYLLLHRDAPQSRAHLAYTLWPDSTDAQAHTNLRNLIHKLRQVLPNADTFLEVNRQTLQWRTASAISTSDVMPSNVTVDVLDFVDALTEAETALQQKHLREARKAFIRAVELYRGDLLPSCYDEWIISERDHFRQKVLKALDALIDLQEQERNYAAAISSAQHLMRADPLHEATYRRLMTFYAANGDRAAALRTYHTCSTILERELGVQPSRTTRELYEGLLKTEAHAAYVPQNTAPTLTATVPLVGRETQWSQLRAAWRTAATGQPHMFLLSGEAGIGKTRLAEELLTWARRQGADTAIARCYATEGTLAYSPVATWLRSEALHTGLAELSPLWRTEVARVLPQLQVEQPELPPPADLTEGWQRQRFSEALARAVLSHSRPLLLLLDDIQWCDRETLEWLHFFLRFDAKAPLLLVCTARAEDMENTPALASFLLSLRREGGGNGALTEVQLEPLDADETAQLATQLLGEELDDAVSSALYQETEGNPLFVVETVRAGSVEKVKTGQLSFEEADSVTLSGTLLPATVQAVIASRLALLSPMARDVMGLAAVIGRAFTFETLSGASSMDEDALVVGLDDLWQRRIIREQGGNAYDFSHQKLREQAYSTLSTARRRLFHRRVAEAIERLHANNLDTFSRLLATHYEQAGLLSQASLAFQRAGEVARRVYANTEAVACFRRALALLTKAPSSSTSSPLATAEQERKAKLYAYLGALHTLLGQYEQALAAYQEALASQPPHEYLALAAIYRERGNIFTSLRSYEAALDCFAQADGVLGAAPNGDQDSTRWWQAWLELQSRKIVALYWLGQMDEIAALNEKIRPLLEQYGTLELQASFYLSQAGGNMKDGRFLATVQTLEYAHIALRLYEQLDDPVNLGWAQDNPGFYHLFLGDLDLAEKYLRDALRTAERIGEATLQLRCLTYLTILFRKRSEVEETEHWSLRSLKVASAGNVPVFIGMAKANLAWVSWQKGQLEEAQHLGKEALVLWQQTATIYPFHWAALWPLLAVALTQQRIAEAIVYAKAVFAPQQLLPPLALKEVMEAAISAWETGQEACTRVKLQKAIVLADELDQGYL